MVSQEIMIIARHEILVGVSEPSQQTSICWLMSNKCAFLKTIHAMDLAWDFWFFSELVFGYSPLYQGFAQNISGQASQVLWLKYYAAWKKDLLTQEWQLWHTCVNLGSISPSLVTIYLFKEQNRSSSSKAKDTIHSNFRFLLKLPIYQNAWDRVLIYFCFAEHLMPLSDARLHCLHCTDRHISTLKQARKPQSSACSKLRPTDWGWSVKLLAKLKNHKKLSYFSEI